MENLAFTVSTGVVILAFVVGLLGIILPVIPGLIIIWLASLYYAAVVVGFDTFSPWIFALITLIGLAAGTSNIWLSALGAKKTGATWRTLVVGFIGAMAGTFLLPIPLVGTIVGYAAGLVLSEYVRQGALRPALKAAFGGMVGWGISTLFEIAGGIMMILLVVTQAPV
ncbi:MAG: DUF456 domain-containing protein [Candidatus Promineofilum sp.]|nr:DUF456 domain-containing protein [Promineifilum sp.]